MCTSNARILSALVVESHPLMREALCAIAEHEAHLRVVGAVACGAEAVPAAIAARPDLIVLALNDLDPDDLRVLSALRQALPGVPILALVYQSTGQERAAWEAGATQVLAKAASHADLKRALEAILAGV